MAQDYQALPVTSAHGVEVDGLPFIHQDPFDRLLVARAMVEGLVLLTAATRLTRYPGPIRKV